MSYIDPKGKVFAHLSRLASWRDGGRRAPVTIEWDLSNRCVLGCQSCHFAYTHVRGPWATKPTRTLPMHQDAAGDLAETTMVLRALREVRDAGVEGIVWTGGGEPTTHPEWMTIVDAAHALGLEQGMYTLGGLLTRDAATFLTEHLTWVVVSLDACDGLSYAVEKGVAASRFDAACNAIRWLSKKGDNGSFYFDQRHATVGISFLLHEGNWREAPWMRLMAINLGATYATFRPTVQTQPDAPGTITADRSWITEALPMLRELEQQADVEISPERFEQYRDWHGHGYDVCHGIKLNATITPDGRVWVCPNRREFAGSSIGDLRIESFSAIWAKHPGQWTDFTECRAMCRLHPVNQTLAAVFQPRKHEAFI